MAKGWVPEWLRSDADKGSDGDKTDDDKKFEVPKELKETIEGTVKASLSPLEEKLKGLDQITAFVEESRREKEEALKAKAIADAKKDDSSDDDLAARLLTDPKSVIDEVTKNQKEFMLMMRADQVKREVFEDSKEEFPYYSGEVKTEVDKVLSEQTLQFRQSPAAVANVYHTVVGKKMKEINEGKIKSRFASSGSNTNGSVKTEDQELNFELTPEIARAAKLSGMETEDYMKLLKKAAKAGEIEYV